MEICKISMTFHLTGISKERMNRKLHGNVLSFYISSFFVIPFFPNFFVFRTFFKNCEISVFKEALNRVLLNILCCQKNVRVPILGQSIIDLIATLSTHWTTQFHGNTRKIFCLFLKKAFCLKFRVTWKF